MRIAFYGDSLTRGQPGSSYVARVRRALPQDDIVNLGVSGDTISSLLARVQRMPTPEPYDIAFLWVGVNDVVDTEALPVAIVSAIRSQRATADLGIFREHYDEALAIVAARADHTVAVSPLLKGERADGALNRRLGQVGEVIREAAAARGDVGYLDLYDEMMAMLGRSPGPDYARAIPWRVVWDIVSAQSDITIDRRAAQRGFYYTIDGLHLNSRGANWVAERFLREIERTLDLRHRTG